MSDWFIKSGGKTSGPFTEAYMSKLRSEGTINAQTVIRKDSEPWRVAGDEFTEPAIEVRARERAAAPPRYQFLTLYGSALAVVGVLSVIFGVVGFFFVSDESKSTAAALGVLFVGVAAGLACLVASEVVKAFVQIAQDIRRGKDAIERLERR